tara:strand:- start:82 stop:702 length:621 start_codon:yes stop_codon:yes gene_type:complete
MKISYAITVCNELDEIQKLILFLLENKREEDEIVILYDINNGHEGIEQFLKEKSTNKEISWMPGEFNGHFADWKNKLTSLCTGDYIYQIDADEMINEYILRLLPQVLEQNDVDVLLVPRINTVKGLTQQHVDKWGWRVDSNGWVNFPDYQWRIYKNNGNIKWKNKVHEVLDGYKTISHLPTNKEWCLIHEKTIERQEQQNKFYETI